MVNYEQIEDVLKISFVNESGNIEFKDIKIPPKDMFNWVYADTADKKYVNWDKKNVRKAKGKWLNKYRVSEFLHSQPESTKKQIFSNNVPRKYFIDIETEVLGEFPTIWDPKAAITTISIASDRDKIITLGTRKVDSEFEENVRKKINEYFAKYGKKIDYKYLYFETEYDMLYTFLVKYVKKFPLISGWNFVDFDWTYILARCEKIYNIDCGVSSPTGKLVISQHPLQDKNKTTADAKVPIHKMVYDYMSVYSTWDTSVKLKESNSLEWVSQKVLGLGKIKYNGSLQELYDTDFFTYVYYNAIDAYLVKMIDETLNTLAVPFSLASLCQVEYSKVWSSISMVENLMSQYLYKDDKIFVKEKKDLAKEKIAGGYVMSPIPGLHTYVATFDYASLYPTIIRQHKISPETFIEKSLGLSKDENVVNCASGAKFKKDEMGILPGVLTNIYSDRKKYKKIWGSIEEEIEFLKGIRKQRFGK